MREQVDKRGLGARRVAHTDAHGDGMMTLQEFLTVTSGVPTSVLRQAIGAALAVEVPRDQPSHARFYGRVLSEIAVPEERWVAAEE